MPRVVLGPAPRLVPVDFWIEATGKGSCHGCVLQGECRSSKHACMHGERARLHVEALALGHGFAKVLVAAEDGVLRVAHASRRHRPVPSQTMSCLTTTSHQQNVPCHPRLALALIAALREARGAVKKHVCNKQWSLQNTKGCVPDNVFFIL